jgi:hypothetical protein
MTPIKGLGVTIQLVYIQESTFILIIITPCALDTRFD